MNGAQLHLALNHVPVIGILFCIFVLGWGLLRRSTDITRVGFVLLVFVGLAAGGAFLTGEPAEEVVEEQPGVSDDRIHEHEESGEFALIVTGIAGALGLVGLVLGRRSDAPRTLGWIALLAAVVAAATLFRTAHLGGQIRHPELRGEVSTGPPTLDDAGL